MCIRVCISFGGGEKIHKDGKPSPSSALFTEREMLFLLTTHSMEVWVGHRKRGGVRKSGSMLTLQASTKKERVGHFGERKKRGGTQWFGTCY